MGRKPKTEDEILKRATFVLSEEAEKILADVKQKKQNQSKFVSDAIVAYSNQQFK